MSKEHPSIVIYIHIIRGHCSIYSKGAGKYLLRIPYLVPTQFQESIPPPWLVQRFSFKISEFMEAERKFTFKCLHMQK